MHGWIWNKNWTHYAVRKNLTSTTVEVKQARIFHVRTVTAENNVNRSVIKWDPSKFQRLLL